MFKSIFLVGALAVAAAPAHAALETVMWSGTQFGDTATAIGHFNISPTAADLGGVQNSHPFPDPNFQLLDLTISGAGVGDGTFTETDFSSYYFASYSPLDFSKQLIGQAMTNGCTYGSFTACYPAASGDFNLFSSGANPNEPSGSFYFTLTAGDGSLLAVTSIAPGGVPEPATWALMLIGLGAVGVAARRRASAIA